MLHSGRSAREQMDFGVNVNEGQISSLTGDGGILERRIRTRRDAASHHRVDVGP